MASSVGYCNLLSVKTCFYLISEENECFHSQKILSCTIKISLSMGEATGADKVNGRSHRWADKAPEWMGQLQLWVIW